MSEFIELDEVDVLGAGAVGVPGQRAFYIQARNDKAELTVLVEKEQVALLATEAVAFLDRLSDEFPEPTLPADDLLQLEATVHEPAVPLFRARLIGLGYDPQRAMVLIELREQGEDEDDEEAITEPDAPDGYVARLYATRSQVRAMAAHGAAAVTAGRPRCPLCDFPMDPDGHLCPRLN